MIPQYYVAMSYMKLLGKASPETSLSYSYVQIEKLKGFLTEYRYTHIYKRDTIAFAND